MCRTVEGAGLDDRLISPGRSLPSHRPGGVGTNHPVPWAIRDRFSSETSEVDPDRLEPGAYVFGQGCFDMGVVSRCSTARRRTLVARVWGKSCRQRTGNKHVTLDPIAEIAEALHEVRPDWPVDDIIAIFRTTTVPRETLLRALAVGYQATGPDGAYLLTRPHDVLGSDWLTAAHAQIDQLSAEDRDQHT